MTWLFGILATLLLLGLMALGARYVSLNVSPAIEPPAPGATRIACVGDSITFGTMVWNRKTNSYPARLQALLGHGYAVRNFGANGRAYQHDADYPYWSHKYFAMSSKFEPDIVLIMLGTNDVRQPNWRNLTTWLASCRELLLHYRQLPCRPRVYVLTPPAMFPEQFKRILRYQFDSDALVDITLALKILAHELQLPLIDVHTATVNRPELFSVDGLHPGAAGANHIAETVYNALKRTVRPDAHATRARHPGTDHSYIPGSAAPPSERAGTAHPVTSQRPPFLGPT